MTNEQKQVKDWMTSFGQECPEKPTLPSLEIRKLRAKLILEEALETIDALGFCPFTVGRAGEVGEEIYLDFQDIDYQVLPLTENSLRNIADGCSDLKVVTEGTLVACGLIDTYRENKNDPLFDEVMRSNWTKLWTQDEVFKVLGHPDEQCFDPTGIIGEDTYCDNDCGTIYKKLKMNPEVSNRLWLVKDKDGKVIKSPSYSPANLQPIIDAL